MSGRGEPARDHLARRPRDHGAPSSAPSSFVVCFWVDASNAWIGGSLALALLGLGLALAFWGRDLAGDEVARRPVPGAARRRARGRPSSRRSSTTTRRCSHAAASSSSSWCSAWACSPSARSCCSARSARGRATACSPRAGARAAGSSTSEGEPVTRDVLATGGFLVAFPEGGDQKADSQIVLLHFVNGEFTPQPGRETWSPENFVAYSRICTHAGCPVAQYADVDQLLLCPCHQSTFDVLHGARADRRPGRPAAAAAAAGHRRRRRALRAERLHRARRPRLLGRLMRSDHDLKRGLGSAFGVRTSPLRPAGRWLHTNLGGSGLLREELRHIFPDSWAFFLGEIALYCFIILVATGIFLALFFQASEAPVVYDGLVRPAGGRGDVHRLRLGAAAQPRRARRPAGAAGAPLGGARLRRRADHPPAAHVASRRRTGGRAASTGSSASPC